MSRFKYTDIGNHSWTIITEVDFKVITATVQHGVPLDKAKYKLLNNCIFIALPIKLKCK